MPYSQLLRIRRNCTLRAAFEYHAAIFKNQMIKRGYPKKLLKHAIKRAWFTPREDLLVKKYKAPLEKLVCLDVWTDTHKLRQIVLKNWHLLENN